MCRPAYVAKPVVGFTMPPAIESMVVLPDPDGPDSAVTSPGRNERVARSRAHLPPTLSETSSGVRSSVAASGSLWVPDTSGPLDVDVAGTAQQQAVDLVGLDPHERALRPLPGDVRREVYDALGPDHDVLRAFPALHPDPAAAHGDGARERAGDLGLVGDDQDRRTEVVAETVDQLEHVVAVLVAE